VHSDEDEKKVKVETEADQPMANGDEPYSDGEDHAGGAGGWEGADGYGDDFQADFNAEEEDIDAMLHDLDTTGRINVKRDASPPRKKEEVKPAVKIEDPDDTPWTSGQQLTLFRDNALGIADEYMKKSKIKLRAGPRISGPNFKKGGYSNYKQGKEDAKKIDVKRKRIKGARQD